MEPFEILCIIGAILIFLYYYTTSNHDFWKNRGVQGPKPLPFMGNFKDLMLNRLSVGDISKKFYDDFIEEPVVGIFTRSTPVLILKDPELIKDILIRDFQNFSDRGLPVHEKIEPLSQHLVNLETERWKVLRRKLSPIFTSGKLREMFHLLEKSSNHLDEYLEKIVPKNEPIECKQLSSKYSIDVIGSCVFGIEINSLSDENNDFIRMGKRIFEANWRHVIKVRIRDLTPWLYQIIGHFLADKELNDFFTNLISDTMKSREENNVVRHDFVDQMRLMKQNPDKVDDIEMTDSLMAAQAFVFFAAGFETSSTTMSNALYELAMNPPIQDKLQEEIREILQKSDGKLTYDNVKSMKYLHKVFQETLRKYPPATIVVRKSLTKYTLRGSDVTIPKGTKIWIPVYAIQRDPKNYPDPNHFDPERFDEEVLKSKHPMIFLPFGRGPRNCIGARFAVFQTKVGIIKILQSYRLSVCDQTPILYVNNPKAFLLTPIGGLYLKFTKLNNDSIKNLDR